ncbi:outer membrane lipoprotein LolB [Halorhodospira abdelmalekii]|uniref:lipoprotein insertase outer membrane protein LolB n=1 Tax=Halorhodospira abdelmalekii TaxID=421629 RepID=UPI001907F09D|nr:lipoprotein insertase outer membrane protein LolB [Halorhodospira abdelmalekii]MBK1734043.1 outer membrane lipoprotein LolB [Halorhodospira abdelmalekii]
MSDVRADGSVWGRGLAGQRGGVRGGCRRSRSWFWRSRRVLRAGGFLLWFGCVVTLGGCAWWVDPDERERAHRDFLAERADLTHWTVQGRAAARANGDGATLGLRWQQLDETFDIRLSGPFGAGAVRVSGHPGAVVLDDGSGQTFWAPDPETLVARHAGYALPVSALRYWILGVESEGLELERLDLDTQGRPSLLIEDGWRVEYRGWAQVDGVSLPARIDLQKGSKQLRVALSGWQLEAGRGE